MNMRVCVGVMHVFRGGDRVSSWTAAVVWGVLWKPRGTWSWSASLQREQWNRWIPQTTAYADGCFRLFIQNLHSSSVLVRYPQLPVCESHLVLLVIYRWTYEVVPCYMTDTEFNGSMHVIVCISASLKLEKSETGRCNILEVEAVAEYSKQKMQARGQKDLKKGDLS